MYDGDNKKTTYRNASIFLKKWTLEYQRDEAPIIVPDPSQANVAWKISGPRGRYVCYQTVARRFTDPDSYAADERKPYTSFSEMTAGATTWSKVDLPAAMGTTSKQYTSFKTCSKMNDWNVTGHKMTRIADGVWEVEVTLMAFSDYIWNKSQMTKVKIAAASTYPDSPIT